jgi:hypothetical protein
MRTTSPTPASSRLARAGRLFRVEFRGEHLAGAVVGHGRGQVEGRDAVRGAELHHRSRPDRPCHRVQQVPARGGDRNVATDIDFAVDQLVGPVYYRVLVTGQPVPPEYTDALVGQYVGTIQSA